MVSFFLQHGALRSYVINHTAMVAIRNKLKSTQFPRMGPKQRLRLKSLSLHFLISFVWRNVHQFVLWGRTHNRQKIGYQNMIATNIFILFSNRFSNQTLDMHLKRFIFTFKIINKFSIQVHIQTLLAFQENFQQVSYISQPIYWIYWA